MTTYTQLLYHIVFSTKNRKYTLTKPNREKLFRIIWVALEKKLCHPYAVNGIENHLHIATHIPPSISISNVVKDIKLLTTAVIKNESLFPLFEGWQEGFAAFSLSIKEKDRVVKYIINQEQHHARKKFEKEYREFLNKAGVDFKEEFLFKP